MWVWGWGAGAGRSEGGWAAKVSKVLAECAAIFGVELDAVASNSVIRKAEAMLGVLALSLTAKKLSAAGEQGWTTQLQHDGSFKCGKNLMCATITAVGPEGERFRVLAGMAETTGATVAEGLEGLKDISRRLHRYQAGADSSVPDEEQCRFIDECQVFTSDYATNATQVSVAMVHRHQMHVCRQPWFQALTEAEQADHLEAVVTSCEMHNTQNWCLTTAKANDAYVEAVFGQAATTGQTEGLAGGGEATGASTGWLRYEVRACCLRCRGRGCTEC